MHCHAGFFSYQKVLFSRKNADKKGHRGLLMRKFYLGDDGRIREEGRDD